MRRALPAVAVLAAAAGLSGCGDGRREGPAPAPGVAAVAPAASPTPAAYQVTGVPEHAGAVRGVVTLTGPVPVLKAKPLTVDAESCGHDELANPSLVLGAGNTVADVVVRLEGVFAGKAFPESSPELDQKGCVFRPHLQVVPPGAVLSVVNSDPVGHNVHAYDGANETLFNVGTALQGVRIDKRVEARGAVRLKCDLHPWMLAWVWVAETPYATATDREGRYALTGVPPGTYELALWHELLGEKRRKVVVPADGEVTADVALSVTGQ